MVPKRGLDLDSELSVTDSCYMKRVVAATKQAFSFLFYLSIFLPQEKGVHGRCGVCSELQPQGGSGTIPPSRRRQSFCPEAVCGCIGQGELYGSPAFLFSIPILAFT